MLSDLHCFSYQVKASFLSYSVAGNDGNRSYILVVALQVTGTGDFILFKFYLVSFLHETF